MYDMVPNFLSSDNFMDGQFWVMCRFNFLGGEKVTHLTYCLPPWLNQTVIQIDDNANAEFKGTNVFSRT